MIFYSKGGHYLKVEASGLEIETSVSIKLRDKQVFTGTHSKEDREEASRMLRNLAELIEQDEQPWKKSRIEIEEGVEK